MNSECSICLGAVLFVVLILIIRHQSRRRRYLIDDLSSKTDRRCFIYEEGGQSKIAWEGDEAFKEIEAAIARKR